MFLKRLAPVWLACRWRVMGHSLTSHNRKWPKADLAFDLLGMIDYTAEMRIVTQEAGQCVRSK
jgi:hypothetical protein